MCLAIPMKIIKKEGDTGAVESGGVTYQVNFSLIPDAAINDYVLVHAGFAIEKLDEADAQETLKLFDEVNNQYD